MYIAIGVARDRPGTSGGHFGAVPPQTRMVPPPKRGLCPKKLTGSVQLESCSRPETPQILVITPKFVSNSCFFCRFWNKHPTIHWNSHILLKWRYFFFGLYPRFCRISRWTFLFFGPHSRIQNLCPSKFVHAPHSRYPGAGPGRGGRHWARPPPSIEIPPMKKNVTEQLFSTVSFFFLASSHTTVHAYNSN